MQRKKEKSSMKETTQPPSTNGKEILEMAKFYFLNSKYDEAIIEFNKALQIYPGNAEAYYNLGLIYENRNQQEKAKEMYERAIAIDENYKLAREHLNKLIGIE